MTSDPAPPRALATWLRGVRRRVAVRRLVERAARVLPYALAACAFALGAGRLLSRTWLAEQPWREAALVVTLAGAAAVALAGLLAALRGRLDDLSAALLADRAFGTRESLATAVALRGATDAPRFESIAARDLGERTPADAVPWRPLPWRASAAASALLAAALVVPPLSPAESEPPPEPVPAVAVAAKALAEETAKLDEKLEARPAPEDARRVLDEIRKQASQLASQPASREQAVIELKRLDQLARDAQQQREAGEAGALSRALSSLEQAQLSRDAARAAQSGDTARLEQELKELAKGLAEGARYEDRELQRLAARLREAAEALKDTSHAELAAQLERLAEALEKGDLAAAAAMLGEIAASPELQAISGEQAAGEALEDARRLVQQALAQMGEAQADAPPAGEGEEPGEGGGANDEERRIAGRGGRDRSGRPVIPMDWGVGTTNEATPDTALGRGHQSDRQSTETSSWREAYEALHESQRLQDARGRSTKLSGQVGEGEYVAVPTRTAATGPGQAAAPVVRLPPSYERAKEDALQQDRVPPGYDESVRKYFTSLAGGEAKEGESDER